MSKIRIIGIDNNIYKIYSNNKIKSKFIMEIVKQNETFNLKDTTEVFEMSGSANRDVSGSLSINVHVNKLNGEHVGEGHYNKYGENGTVTFSINCVEGNRDTLTAYVDSVVDSVLAHFQTIN